MDRGLEKFTRIEEEPELQSARLEKMQQHYLGLEKQLGSLREQFIDGYSEAMFDYISEDSAEEFTGKWLEKVRRETTLLSNADELGIKVFSGTIENQDSLLFEKYSKGGAITFDPNLDLSHKGKPPSSLGEAERGGRIRLKGESPKLKEQLVRFISQGKLHPNVSRLIHEVVHQYHFDANTEIEGELSEAQAYSNGVIEPLSFDSIEDTAEHISKDYGYPKNRIASITRNILFLYSRGESVKAVGDKLRAINPNIQGDWALREFHIKPILKIGGISEEEKEKMIDVYLLEKQIQIAKAQNIFLDSFGEWMEE